MRITATETTTELGVSGDCVGGWGGGGGATRADRQEDRSAVRPTPPRKPYLYQMCLLDTYIICAYLILIQYVL